MKLAYILIILSIIILSCNQRQNIIGKWKASKWEGESYSVFNLKLDSNKSKFDEFVYNLFTESNKTLFFKKDSTFKYGNDSSTHFQGKYKYLPDSSLKLFLENENLNFSILKEINDSIFLFLPDSKQIQVKNIKLTISR